MPLRRQVGLEEFPKGPPDRGQHGQARVLELGVAVADEALGIGREAERIKTGITGQSHFVEHLRPVQEREGLGRRRAEILRTVRDDDARRAAVADWGAEVRRIVVYRTGAVVALDRVGEAERALQNGHVVLLAGPGRRVREDAGLVLEAEDVSVQQRHLLERAAERVLALALGLEQRVLLSDAEDVRFRRERRLERAQLREGLLPGTRERAGGGDE